MSAPASSASTGLLAPGTEITVQPVWPEELGPCHVRTPSYVRGRRGRIVGELGSYPNPESLAFGRPAALRRLYHVRFRLSELWPQEGSDTDHVVVELYEHWFTCWEEPK